MYCPKADGSIQSRCSDHDGNAEEEEIVSVTYSSGVPPLEGVLVTAETHMG